MMQKTSAVVSAILAFVISVSQLIFTPNVIRIDFDNVFEK